MGLAPVRVGRGADRESLQGQPKLRESRGKEEEGGRDSVYLQVPVLVISGYSL